MFDTYYCVKWNEEGQPELKSGRLNATGPKGKVKRVRLNDGFSVQPGTCHLTPIAAIEREILHIASTHARNHCLKPSQRAWVVARMIQKLCHLAKTIRLTSTHKPTIIKESQTP